MSFKRLGIASDHAGRELKAHLLEYLQSLGLNVKDYGVAADSSQSVDYPDYAALLARDISTHALDGGIAICGTGIGMAISGNKFKGVRAASIWDEYSCRMSRAHNDLNLLCLGARILTAGRAADLLQIWLDTAFLSDRHQQRLSKIAALELANFKA